MLLLFDSLQMYMARKVNVYWYMQTARYFQASVSLSVKTGINSYSVVDRLVERKIETGKEGKEKSRKEPTHL